jgi:poly-beta-1,6-N-acetyl-D-glucosamine synthase
MDVTVMSTVNNRARRAGAINQALTRILTGHRPDFYVLVMDADTELSPEWIETAARRCRRDLPRVDRAKRP